MNALQALRAMAAGKDLICHEDNRCDIGGAPVSEAVALDMVCRRWIEWLPMGAYGLARIATRGWDRLDEDERRRKHAQRLHDRARVYRRQWMMWRRCRDKALKKQPFLFETRSLA